MLALSRSTWHYPTVDLGQIVPIWHHPKVDLGHNLAKLALSNGEFGSKFGQVGTIRRWIWPKIWQGGYYRTCWHYPRVDLGQIWAKLALSKGGFGSKCSKVGIIRGWIWSKIWQGGHYRACWHYPRVDLDRKWSILVTIDTFKGGSGPKLGKPNTIVHVGTIQGWVWAKFEPSWHYPKVDLVQIWAKLALSGGGSGPKFGRAGTIVHVGTIQGWTWAQSGQSS